MRESSQNIFNFYLDILKIFKYPPERIYQLLNISIITSDSCHTLANFSKGLITYRFHSGK
jgi:hypothetical protein